MKNKIEITTLKLKQIQENELNNRSMDSAEILNMANAIVEGGVYEPLIVYKNKAGSNYTLVSGHRRLAALRQVLDKDDEIICLVSKRPDTKFQEQEMLTRLNIHRSTPEDIQNEAKLASRLWQTMDSDKKAALTNAYKDEFIKKYEDHSGYLSDPKKFIKDRFRPKLDYIRSITGLDVSNSTIKDILSDPVEKEKKKSEKIEAERKEKDDEKPRDKNITDKDLLRQAESLLGVLKVHFTDDENLNARKGVCNEALETLIEYLR